VAEGLKFSLAGGLDFIDSKLLRKPLTAPRCVRLLISHSVVLDVIGGRKVRRVCLGHRCWGCRWG